MKHYALALGLALGLSTSAHAYTITVSDTPVVDNSIFGSCVGLQVCSTDLGFFTLTGGSSIAAGGESTINHIAPAPTGAYAVAYGSGKVTLQTTAPLTSIEFNWGSIDTTQAKSPGYNPIFAGDGENIFTAGDLTLTGATILGLMHEPYLAGRSVGVEITGLDPFTTATWTNSPFSIFEFNAVSPVLSGGGEGAVPETGTWAMLLMGFACIGFSIFRQRLTTVSRT